MEPSQGAGVDGAVIRLGLAIAKGAKRVAGHTEIEPTLSYDRPRRASSILRRATCSLKSSCSSSRRSGALRQPPHRAAVHLCPSIEQVLARSKGPSRGGSFLLRWFLAG